MHDSLPEHELKNQYISVLLEFYGMKQEMLPQSPMDRARLRYWQRIVSLFERLKEEKIRNRARYRAKRAETRKLSPIQVALVRYAWTAFYEADEDDQAVQRRWEQYLYRDRPESNGNMTEYEFFRQKRQFKEIIAGIKREDLWPWQ
jgi:hypothetical protein